MDDLSDVIALVSSGTFTVTRPAASTFLKGRRIPSVVAEEDWSPWAPNASVDVEDVVTNGGHAYECIDDGITAPSGGPTGTGADIVDGTAHWKWLGAVATTFTITASVQPLRGRELDRLAGGDRAKEIKVVFTSTELRTVTTSTDADTITIDGEKFEVQTCERWTQGNFFRALVAKVGRT